jgi:hypothetical protein
MGVSRQELNSSKNKPTPQGGKSRFPLQTLAADDIPAPSKKATNPTRCLFFARRPRRFAAFRPLLSALNPTRASTRIIKAERLTGACGEV